MHGLSVGIDTGGTFTDVILRGLDGRLWVTKTPSTPDDHSRSFKQALQKVLHMAGVAPAQLDHVFHGTTVGTNAVLERTLAPVALVTTRGFRHVLHIGRHDVPVGVPPYAYVKPERPVTPDRIFEVTERMDHLGRVLAPLDEVECRRVARHIHALGVEAVAVCLLHSYANPAHEERVGAILAEELPGVPLSLSSQVNPVFREFERCMNSVWNAGVAPLVSRNVTRLEQRTHELGIAAPLLIMKSNGGLCSTRIAAEQGIQMLLSGPAAGAVGAAWVGQQAGFQNVISIDVGGTSADVTLVKDGKYSLTSGTEVGGLPLTIPMIDLVTIGAGGGSIAHFSATGNWLVGPRSAGAAPGPVCYGQGGTEPTVTDANVVLGRVPPYLLGGEIPLDVGAARRAIQEKLAARLGLTLAEAAEGILDILCNNMAGAIRAVSVERGHDPADFVLVPCGGAGPLFGSQLAWLLGIRRLLVPRYPGALSTLGLLSTDLMIDYALTSVHRQPDYDLARMARGFAGLEADARRWLASQGMSPGRVAIHRQVDARYEGQGFEVTTPVPGGEVNEAFLGTIQAAFEAEHQRLYDHTQERAIEFVNLRVRGVGAMPRPAPRRREAAGGAPRPRERRSVLFSLDRGDIDCPVYHRDDLGPGARITGPAIIEQVDSTVVLFPDDRLQADAFENAIIDVALSQHG